MVKVRPVLISAMLISIAGLCSANRTHWSIVPYDVKNYTHLVLPTRRIWGGSPAPEGKYMYLVFVLLGTSKCTGGLIKRDWVLFAAHCVDKGLKLGYKTFVVGGKADLTDYFDEKRKRVGFRRKVNETKFHVREIPVKRCIVHPKYNPRTLHYDIALLQLKEPMTGLGIKVIPMSTKRMNKIMSCTIHGWGRKPGDISPYVLYHLEDQQSGISPKGCKWSKKKFVCVSVSRGGICKGDSGSPLVCNGKIWGVCSHSGVPSLKNISCGDALEDYFTEVYPHLKWVNGVMNGADLMLAPRKIWAWVAGFWFTSTALKFFNITLPIYTIN